MTFANPSACKMLMRAAAACLCASAMACNSILGISDPKVKDAAVATEHSDTSIEPERPDAREGGPSDASSSLVDTSDAATGSESSADGGRDASNDQDARDDHDARDATSDGARRGVDGSPLPDADGATMSAPDAQTGCSSGPCPLLDQNRGYAPYNFILDDVQPYLYWTELMGGRVGRTHKETGETMIIAQAVGAPNGVAIDETNIYWADNTAGGVWRCPKAGCGAGPQLVSTGCGSSLDVALDDRNAYWTGKFGLSIGTVCSAPKDGADAGFTSLWYTETLPWRIANDRQGRLFFTAADGLLHRMDVDGGSLASLGNADGSAPSLAIGLDLNSVYWTVDDPTAGSVNVMAKDGTTSRLLASSQRAPRGLATDGINLYWASYGTGPDGAILTCNPAGCGSPTTLVRNAPYAHAILVDDVAIYWIESDQSGHPGSIWRMTKN